MRAAVVVGRHLDVLVILTAILIAVFDAQVGKLHPIVCGVRQVVLVRPVANLIGCPVGMAVVVVAVLVPLVQPSLVFALELVVEDDAFDLSAVFVQALRLAFVGAVDPEVVFELALAFEAVVEGLAAIRVSVSRVPMALKHGPPFLGQHDGVVAGPGNADGLYEALLPKMPQVA